MKVKLETVVEAYKELNIIPTKGEYILQNENNLAACPLTVVYMYENDLSPETLDYNIETLVNSYFSLRGLSVSDFYIGYDNEMSFNPLDSLDFNNGVYLRESLQQLYFY